MLGGGGLFIRLLNAILLTKMTRSGNLEVIRTNMSCILLRTSQKLDIKRVTFLNRFVEEKDQKSEVQNVATQSQLIIIPPKICPIRRRLI